MSNESTGNSHHDHQVTGSSHNPRWLFDTQTTETVDQASSIFLVLIFHHPAIKLGLAVNEAGTGATRMERLFTLSSSSFAVMTFFGNLDLRTCRGRLKKLLQQLQLDHTHPSITLTDSFNTNRTVQAAPKWPSHTPKLSAGYLPTSTTTPFALSMIDHHHQLPPHPQPTPLPTTPKTPTTPATPTISNPQPSKSPSNTV